MDRAQKLLPRALFYVDMVLGLDVYYFNKVLFLAYYAKYI